MTSKITFLNNGISVLAISSVIIVLFLFYIDEGFYNFRWMLNIGNWIAFSIYFTVIYFFQLLVYLLLPKKLENQSRIFISLPIGAIAGIIFVIKIIFIGMSG